MTETVIKHYKKQLIYRQKDVPERNGNDEVNQTKVYEFEEAGKKNDTTNGKKVRRKRKNKNCRGQFRHEAMELIKLGTNPSHTLCRPKDPFTRAEKPPDAAKSGPPPQPKSDARNESNAQSVITVNKTILENLPKQSQYVHTLPQMVPERRNSREFHLKPPPYKSPPHRPVHQPEYRAPYPLPHPAYSLPLRPTPTLPPPPYPIARSPPRPVPRSPVRPIPHSPVPYSGINFPFVRHNRYHPEYHEKKKRKLEDNHPVVAAIDLTVDQKKEGHKCHCECGKSYVSDPVSKEVIVTVKDKVPSTYTKGQMVKLDQNDTNGFKNKPNGTAKTSNKGGTTEGKLPQLFLIEDLLAKGVVPKIHKPKEPVPNRVIVNTKRVEETGSSSKDYSVSTIIGTERRQSVDIDTISISSSGSEPVRSPRPKSNGADKQVPQGKLFYYKSNNSFIRYFDEAQKKIFIDNITSDGRFEKPSREDKEIIELPTNTIFSTKDSLTVEEYVSEMNLVEKFIPRDFFLFYKFVTGYQICNNNLPVSFLTFLKVYNTNGLNLLLERYVSGMKPN